MIDKETMAEQSNRIRLCCCLVGPKRLGLGVEAVTGLLGNAALALLACEGEFLPIGLRDCLWVSILAFNILFLYETISVGRGGLPSGKSYEIRLYVRSLALTALAIACLITSSNLCSNLAAFVATANLPIPFFYGLWLKRRRERSEAAAKAGPQTPAEPPRPPSYSLVILNPPSYHDFLRLYGERRRGAFPPRREDVTTLELGLGCHPTTLTIGEAVDALRSQPDRESIPSHV